MITSAHTNRRWGVIIWMAYIISCSLSGLGQDFCPSVFHWRPNGIRWLDGIGNKFGRKLEFMCENNSTYTGSNSAQIVFAGWPEKPWHVLLVGQDSRKHHFVVSGRIGKAVTKKSELDVANCNHCGVGGCDPRSGANMISVNSKYTVRRVPESTSESSQNRVTCHFGSTWRPQKGWIWNPPIQHEIHQVIGHRGVSGQTACNYQCHWHIEDGSLYQHLTHSPSIASRKPNQTVLWNISATWRIPKMVIKAFAGHNSCPGTVQKKQELQGLMNTWGPQTLDLHAKNSKRLDVSMMVSWAINHDTSPIASQFGVCRHQIVRHQSGLIARQHCRGVDVAW